MLTAAEQQDPGSLVHAHAQEARPRLPPIRWLLPIVDGGNDKTPALESLTLTAVDMILRRKPPLRSAGVPGLSPNAGPYGNRPWLNHALSPDSKDRRRTTGSSRS